MSDRYGPPPMDASEYARRSEADQLADDRYWAREDRGDRHEPAPDSLWPCERHGPHRFILGCPACKAEERAVAA